MRIGNSSSGIDLVALHNYGRAGSLLAASGTRLATMRRINGGGDDPAGLIAVQQMLSELTSIQKAQDNAARAAGAIHVADAAMGEVGNLLNSIQANVLEVAGSSLSKAEIDAKQIEINAALEAIDRIGNTTSFGGRKLLDGSASSLTLALSPDVGETSELSLPKINSSALGDGTNTLSQLAGGGSLSLSGGDFAAAMGVIDGARDQVLTARASAGTFERFTIDSGTAVLDSMEENLSAAVSRIGDTDVAEEASKLVRAQILVDAAASAVVLSSGRNSAVGSLLGSAL